MTGTVPTRRGATALSKQPYIQLPCGCAFSGLPGRLARPTCDLGCTLEACYGEPSYQAKE